MRVIRRKCPQEWLSAIMATRQDLVPKPISANPVRGSINGSILHLHPHNSRQLENTRRIGLLGMGPDDQAPRPVRNIRVQRVVRPNHMLHHRMDPNQRIGSGCKKGDQMGRETGLSDQQAAHLLDAAADQPPVLLLFTALGKNRCHETHRRYNIKTCFHVIPRDALTANDSTHNAVKHNVFLVFIFRLLCLLLPNPAKPEPFFRQNHLLAEISKQSSSFCQPIFLPFITRPGGSGTNAV